jgi:hypothetical protein
MIIFTPPLSSSTKKGMKRAKWSTPHHHLGRHHLMCLHPHPSRGSHGSCEVLLPRSLLLRQRSLGHEEESDENEWGHECIDVGNEEGHEQQQQQPHPWHPTRRKGHQTQATHGGDPPEVLSDP